MLQAQSKLPLSLEHTAFELHGLLAQGSISIRHLKPFPEYPMLQEHLKLPTVFKQVAFKSHGLFKHSFISKEQKVI